MGEWLAIMFIIVGGLLLVDVACEGVRWLIGR